MKFSHRIVAASSALLLVTVTLLTIKQYYSIQMEMQAQVEASVTEIVDGVRNTVSSEIEARKQLAAYTTSLIEQDLTPGHTSTVITRPIVKNAFLLVGFGYEKDSTNINNNPSWDPGAGWDPRARPWYKDAKQADEGRTLAQKNQQSTTQIRNMIEQLQLGARAVADVMHQSKETAKDAVTRAQDANTALDKIREAILQITDMNLQIASAAEEQSLVAEEINNNTIRIKDLSVQVSDTAIRANSAMDTQTQHIKE